MIPYEIQNGTYDMTNKIKTHKQSNKTKLSNAKTRRKK